MIALRPSRLIRLGLGFGLASLLASSCVVDRSGLVFDDDEYQAALGEGGEGGQGGDASASGGGPLGNGGLGGETSTGGVTGGGGMGGSGDLCELDAMQCDGKQVQLCSNNQWIAIGGPCPNACVNGLCTGMCSPGADECLSSIQTQHCNEVGEWEDEYCEFACVGGTCGGVCRPGDRDCEGDSPTLCGEDGEWDVQDACPGTCDTGVCVGSCNPSDTQCSGDAENPVQITCDSVDWESSTHTPCDYICEQGTGECGGECTPFTSACASNTSVKVCDSTAYYGAPADCTYVCDDSTGACAGECVPGTKHCSSSTIQTCDEAGHWVDETTCSGTTSVCLEQTPGEPACVACAPGAKKCADSANSVLTCSASGAWPDTGAACKSLKTNPTVCYRGACESTSDVCPSSCTKGCPRGCTSASTRWYCTTTLLGGTSEFDSATCASPTSCSAGVCE